MPLRGRRVEMVGEKIEKKDPLEEELSKMSDQELISLVQVENDVIQNDCFNHKDVLIREYAIRELGRRGYHISNKDLVIERGDEE